MKITHIYHSGFAVELTHCILIFDWYKGVLPEFTKADTGREKTYFVFASHAHGDHFNPSIFKLMQPGRTVHYILSNDIHAKATDPAADICFVMPHKSYDIDGIHVETLFSTDLGVAFYIEAEGHTFYHAGDLNLWYWNGEPDQDNLWQIEHYHKEIDLLQGKKIEVAFLPLDSRLEEHGADGVLYFMEHVGAEYVFPMHYWDDLDGSRAYLSQAELRPYRDAFHFEDCFLIPDSVSKR